MCDPAADAGSSGSLKRQAAAWRGAHGSRRARVLGCGRKLFVCDDDEQTTTHSRCEVQRGIREIPNQGLLRAYWSHCGPMLLTS